MFCREVAGAACDQVLRHKRDHVLRHKCDQVLRHMLPVLRHMLPVLRQMWVGGEEEDEEQTVSCRHNTPNVHKHGLDTLLVSAPLIPTVRLDGTVTSGNVLTAPPPTILSADLTTGQNAVENWGAWLVRGFFGSEGWFRRGGGRGSDNRQRPSLEQP
ncbi:hypothetical protein J6590_076376 [Homalodisca vitripennis]|nr:hypothetical protein J6590_076376 [Homalodisca vitripennis]